MLRAEDGAVTSSEVAERLGLHANTVRLHLEHLVEAGLATRAARRRQGRGRPLTVYTAVPVPEFEPSDGDPGDADPGYRLLAEILAGHLESTAAQPAETAAAAGRTWGRILAGRAGPAVRPAGGGAPEAVADELTGLLDRLGFAPRRTTETAAPATTAATSTTTTTSTTIELHRCPFGQVAERHSAVVCAVHLGLMQGALQERGAPLRVAGVEPFASPRVCLARLDATA